MAITIQAAPANYYSAHGDLIYTVASDKTADPVSYPNYKFIADVYVGADLVARIKKIPNPQTGIGIFNVGQIIRNYLKTVFNPGTTFIAQELGEGENFLDIIVKFGEEVDYEPTYNLTVDTTRRYFNHYNGRLIGVMTALSPVLDKIASNRPGRLQTLFGSQFLFIPYLPGSGSLVPVTLNNSEGLNFTGGFTPSFSGVMQVLNISPAGINNFHSNTVTPNTKWYSLTISGVTYRVDVICEAIYQPYTIHFLNKYGGFESMIFSKVSRKSVEVSKKDYGRVAYEVDNDGVVSYRSASGVYYETRSVYSSQFVEKLRLNTDLLTDGDYRWLEQLIISPMVYLEDSGYFLPVQVKDNNYEPKKVVNDDLTNLELSVEYGNQLNAQSR